MIAVGGFKVFPSQIEEILYHHPAVREALVIGITDSYHGEMPKAFVTLAEGADVDGQALKAWLNPELGRHERLAAVDIRPSLPTTIAWTTRRKTLVARARQTSS